MFKRTVFQVFLCFLLVALWISPIEAQQPKPVGLVINEDNSHFYGTRTADDMTLEGLNRFVDQYAGTSVSHLFLCPNAMRASFKSSVWDAIWDLGNQTMPSDGGKRWMDNARVLHERGLDPYAVWIARCREKGISPWLSMRMNDVHDVSDPTNFMHSTFWVNHPEYWRVPGSTSGWVERALDYAIPEVREHNLKFIRELLERYDADGLELDWMRFGYHFKPGHEEEGRLILIDFMRQVRQLTNESSEKRGHPVKLGARVPTHPDAARGLGMDGVAWVQEGLVDMLVPTPFWTSSDFDISVELWREQIGDASKNIVLAPGLEYNIRAYPSGAATPNDLETMRGFAASAWCRGADQIYLFNYMDSETIPVSQSDYRTLIQNGLGPDLVATLPRRHVQTFRDTVPPNFPNGAVLPVEAPQGVTFHIHTGKAPSKAEVSFLAGLASRDGIDAAEFRVELNGAPCEYLGNLDNPGQLPGTARALRFACPLPSLKDGYNDVLFRQVGEAPAQQIVWAEIRVVPSE